MIQNIQNDLQAARSLLDVDLAQRGSFAMLLSDYEAKYLLGNTPSEWQFDLRFEWDTTNTRRDLGGVVLLQNRDSMQPLSDGSCPLTALASASLPLVSCFEYLSTSAVSVLLCSFGEV